MIKRLATAGLFAAVSFTVAPAAVAADCGLIAVLSPCVTPPPPVQQPAPVPLPVPLPGVDPVPQLVAPAPVSAPPPAAAPTAIALVPEAANRIAQLVNQERSTAGLPALAASGRLASIAAGHSMAMAKRSDIWHNGAYSTTASRHDLGARALGENVAVNGSIDDAHRRLMASPGHRANILNGAFDAVGMAVARDAGGRLYVTQNFMDSSGSPVAPARPTAPKVAPPTKAAKPGAVFRPAAVAPTPAAASAVAPAAEAPPASGDASVLSAASGADSPAGPAPGGRRIPLVAVALGLLATLALALTRIGLSGTLFHQAR